MSREIGVILPPNLGACHATGHRWSTPMWVNPIFCRIVAITTALVFSPSTSGMPWNRKLGRLVYCSLLSASASNVATFVCRSPISSSLAARQFLHLLFEVCHLEMHGCTHCLDEDRGNHLYDLEDRLLVFLSVSGLRRVTVYTAALQPEKFKFNDETRLDHAVDLTSRHSNH